MSIESKHLKISLLGVLMVWILARSVFAAELKIPCQVSEVPVAESVSR